MSEPLYNIHQDTKSARLIAVCKRRFSRHIYIWDWPPSDLPPTCLRPLPKLCKCCNLIGYVTRYLFVNRYRVAASNATRPSFSQKIQCLFLVFPLSPRNIIVKYNIKEMKRLYSLVKIKKSIEKSKKVIRWKSKLSYLTVAVLVSLKCPWSEKIYVSFLVLMNT